jgi:signal transduction histidine kinase
MTLGTRIRLALGIAGLVPVLVLGWQAAHGAREELTATVGGALGRQASELARSCERITLDRLRGLRQTASYIPFDQLSRADMAASLVIPYRQSPDLNILAVLDRQGRAVTDVMSERRPDLDPGLLGHEPIDGPGLEAFSRAVPLQAALDAGLAVGPPYRAPSTGVPRVVLAVRLEAAEGRVLAAELSLGDLAGPLQDAAGEGVAYLVDGGGGVLSGTTADALSPEEQGLVAEGARAAAPLTRTVRRADGQPWLAAFAPVGALGWAVVVAQPAAVALRAADRVQRQALGWAVAALVLSGVLALILTVALVRPVRQLTGAVVALRDGRFDAPLPAAGGDELGTLAGAFSHMAAEVRRRDEEIRAFNADLQGRVEARTRELKAAEAQIARTRRLTALGSLSAGVAHGLNNPMTSVVGLVTMARAQVGPDTEPGALLGKALAEARRVTGVVRDLRRLAAPGLMEGARRFALDRPVAAAVDRIRPAAAKAGLELSLEVEGALPQMEGDAEQVESMVARLLENAVAATPSGGSIAVALSVVEGAALRLTVRDTGRGIPAELRDRIFDPFFSTSQAAGAGLGLTLVHGIVEAHHGRIELASEPGRGTTFTLHFPASAAPAHLA